VVATNAAEQNISPRSFFTSSGKIEMDPEVDIETMGDRKKTREKPHARVIASRDY